MYLNSLEGFWHPSHIVILALAPLVLEDKERFGRWECAPGCRQAIHKIVEELTIKSIMLLDLLTCWTSANKGNSYGKPLISDHSNWILNLRWQNWLKPVKWKPLSQYLGKWSLHQKQFYWVHRVVAKSKNKFMESTVLLLRAEITLWNTLFCWLLNKYICDSLISQKFYH